MKLYVWRPDGHGQKTFMVVAASEDEGRQAVTAYIKENYDSDYGSDGWGTDYYMLEVFEPGQVAENDND